MQVLGSGGEAALKYCIVNPLDSVERPQVVHHDRLKPYTLPLPELTVPATPSPTSPPALGALPVPCFSQFWDQPQAGGLDNGLWGDSLGLSTRQSRRGRVV